MEYVIAFGAVAVVVMGLYVLIRRFSRSYRFTTLAYRD
jgi:hypothetical protein